MRGEHVGRMIGLVIIGGSSPHARGAPVAEGVHDALGGIIPACAGSTASRATTVRSTRDHPRMRGEHHRRGA